MVKSSIFHNYYWYNVIILILCLYSSIYQKEYIVFLPKKIQFNIFFLYIELYINIIIITNIIAVIAIKMEFLIITF